MGHVDPRIVGGKKNSISKAPYVVALVDEKGCFCTGAIIDPRWVLTAAHCASNQRTPTHIRVGSTSGITGGELYPVKEIVRHPSYDSNRYNWDFALIKLSRDIHFSDNVKAATMIEQNEPVEVGNMVTVSGYGVTGSFWDWFHKNTLRSVNVPLVSQHDCDKAYPGRITAQMICAGYPEGGRDACQGDSGGPLTDGGKLVGIVSWGNGCGKPGFPGIYGSVSKVRSWIKEVTGI